jgi:threonine dehydratase
MSSALADRLPTPDDVLKASAIVAPLVRRTPVLRSEALDALTGCEVFIKAECLQETGSFKLRGASHRLAALTAEERRNGVVAFSSGNHAQGVARAARRLGVSATIVMPEDAPAVKQAGVREDGGTLVLYDRARESREAIAAQIAQAENRVLVPSYDDPWIIAGQGSAGVEFAQDMAEAHGGALDHLICCAGGGGLIAGLALAFEALSPQTRIWSAEPEGHDDHRLSLLAGRRVPAAGGSAFCDAILTPLPGEMTFAINRARLAGGFAVSDAQVRTAMRFAFSRLKLVVEPGGAAALASLMTFARERLAPSRVGILLTGGNVDPAAYASVIAGEG